MIEIIFIDLSTLPKNAAQILYGEIIGSQEMCTFSDDPYFPQLSKTNVPVYMSTKALPTGSTLRPNTHLST